MRTSSTLTARETTNTFLAASPSDSNREVGPPALLIHTHSPMPDFSTNIRVSAETYRLLQERKHDGESFDAALRRELD
jgi:hypothetical protein